MINFDFKSPTEIVFGQDSISKLEDIISRNKYTKILIVYGSDRIVKEGLFEKITSQIIAAKSQYFVLKGIRPNPEISDVNRGLEIAKTEKINLVLAIGGGSVIDTAKSIAVGYFYDGDPFDFNRHFVQPKQALPVGVILTIASAGSELSNSCVIQNDILKIKSGFNSDIVRPVFAIEDPTLTFGVSKFQTAVGIADTIMHSLERLCNKSDEFGLSDEFAVSIIRKTMESGERCLENPNDYEARATLLLCSSLSHNGLTSIGKEAPFNVHPIEHGLSGYAPSIVHGAGVALIYPAWAEYVYKLDISKFSFICEQIFKKTYKTEEETAIMGIAHFREFFSKIGMPSSLKDVGLTKKDIPYIADLITDNGTRVIGRYPKSLDREDIKNILLKLS